MKRPIFIGITRSFWLGIVPALLVALDLLVALAQSDTVGPVAELLELTTGINAATATTLMRGIAPLAAIIIAQQRAGAARPYTLKVNPETLA